MDPRAGGPAAHYHKAISEAFFVLWGGMRLYDGETCFDATKDDDLYVPPSGIHGFRNEADEPANRAPKTAPWPRPLDQME
jgi:mannose-6-phosphate isomerase-like protein (cupin superfamily)